ncbi:tripartite tricarboxylate transporter TctB family protein [Ornithinibacillus halotolerans]|uniref:DUF1468 domain-containing protein n=1 Tax=Ornithinibacillus halotolerans TaxID=1274357 RepID=A0A916WE71_9BACI|nr:tripartite tricarboxylate transporter TctB family protein [Ornithinibacillus halotolerans]GGA91303.1 hypothetical protein GCM10008025_37240 [Ornithinibacillus halotolerans]
MIKSKNKLAATIIFVISIVYMFFAIRLPAYDLVPVDSDVVPYVLGVLLLILSIILFFEKDPKSEDEEGAIKIDKSALKMLTFIAVIFILYAILFEVLGFIVSSTLFIFVSSLALGYKKTMVNVIVSITTPIVFYYIFDLLQISLPKGILPFL